MMDPFETLIVKGEHYVHGIDRFTAYWLHRPAWGDPYIMEYSLYGFPAGSIFHALKEGGRVEYRFYNHNDTFKTNGQRTNINILWFEELIRQNTALLGIDLKLAKELPEERLF